MIKKYFMIVILLVFLTNLFAEPEKSALKAMAMSAVFPGSGQMYLGNSTKAGIFMATDIIIIGSYVRFNKERNIATDNYKMYANVKADLRRGTSNDIYALASKYRSSDEYNNFLAQDLQNYLIAGWITQKEQEDYYEMHKIKDEDKWNWEYDSHFREYRTIRSDKQMFELYGNLAIGALMLNRIISMLDATIFSNRINRENKLYSMPDFEKKGISLIYEYKF